MKTNFFVKKYFFSSLLATFSVALVLTACDKENSNEDNGRTYSLSGAASGSQEVSAVTTSAAGSLDGSYSSSTNTLNYTINWTGLSGIATSANFHGPAGAGVNADILLPLTITTNAVDGSATGSVVVSDSIENAILGGKVYYNVNTASNPNGEIRGQVLTSPN